MAGWPAGYPSKGAWAFYDVTQSAAFWPRLESVSISQSHPDGIATLECEVADVDADLTFEDEDEAYVTYEGTKVWAGRLRVVVQDMMSEHGPRAYRLTGQDYTAQLDDDIIGTDTERPRELVSARVTWILSKLDLSITTSGVVLPSEYVDPEVFEGSTIREALQRTADELLLHFRLDFDKDLHMFRSETTTAPFSLDDTSPDYSTSFPYSEWTLERDSLELTNYVKVKGKRHVRIVWDDASLAAYGHQRSIIVDDSLRTVKQVKAAAQRRLNQLAEPIIDGSLTCWEPGLQAGMTIGIVNDLWGIDGTYIISGIEITAVDPHDAGGDAHLRTAVSFTDKRRVGRFPAGKGGGRGGGEKERIRKAINKRNRSTPDLGDCCTPVPITGGTITDFSGGGTLAQEDDSTDSSTGTSHTLAIPDGSNVVGRVLALFVANNDWTDDVQAELEGQGFYTAQSRQDPPYEALLMVRVIDGTEGFTGTSDTISLTTSGSMRVQFVADLLSDVYASETVEDWITIITASATDDPPNLNDPGWAEDTLYLAWIVTDGTDDITSVTDPTGYTVLQWSLDGGGSFGDELASRVAYKFGSPANENPSAFVNADDAKTVWTIAIRGSGGGSVLGVVPPGPTWDGGNPYVDESVSPPTVEVVGENVVVTSSTAGADWWQRASGPPDLPTDLEDWSITVSFSIDVLGDVGDPEERYLAIYVNIDGDRMGAQARFGDGTRAQGVLLDGASEQFAAKSIDADEVYSLKLMYRDGTAYAKLWKASTTEPGWDLSTTSFGTTSNDDSLEVGAILGNDGAPAQVLTIQPLTIEGGAQSGEAVDWEVIGTGDGSTVAFTTTYPYVANTLQVRIDAQVLNSGVTETSPDAGTVTLSRAPYGDPDDSTGSSTVEARYTRQ